MLRAGVFAAACVLLAACGHVLMAPAPVPPQTLLLVWAGATAGAWCAAGRERGPVAVGLLTVGTQALAHWAFSLGQSAAHHASHGMPPDGPPAAGSGMTAAHGLVALIGAWWLWGGERAVFRLLRAASARLFRPLALRPTATPPAPAPLRGDLPESPPPTGELLLGHVIWLRGPPAVLAVR